MASTTAGEVLGYKAPGATETTWLPVLMLDSNGAPVTSLAYNAAGMAVEYAKGDAAFAAWPTAFAASNWRERGHGWYDVGFVGSEADEAALLDTRGDFGLYVKCDATRGDTYLYRVVPADVARPGDQMDLIDAPNATAVGAISDSVWDEPSTDHVAADSTGKALSEASAAGDPWSVEAPGDYEEGTFGYRVGTLLDAQLSTVGGTLVLAAASNQITVDASGEAVDANGNLSPIRGTTTTWAFTATGKTLIGHELWMTVRATRDDVDDDATDATAVFTKRCVVKTAVASVVFTKRCVVTGATTFSLTLTPTETDECVLGTRYVYEIRDVTAGDSLICGAAFRVLGSVVKRTA